MKRRKKRRYVIISVLAVGLFLFSYRNYEQKQHNLARTVNETIKEEVDSEDLLSDASTTETTGLSSTEESSEATPQSVKEPTIIKGLILVNKKNPLPETYDPGENKEAVAAMKSMIEEMQGLALDISTEYSGYRSYKEQEELYKSYVKDDGQNSAETYSSRPGYSEHQTGLAFDFIDGAGELAQAEKEAAWIADNAHRYGFIVRYQKGKEAITGYMNEVWHVRYVGKEPAKEMKEKNLTLEEYLDAPGGEYEKNSEIDKK